MRSSKPLHLFDSVEAAIAEAQRLTELDPTSQESRVAWDIVEELEAADSHNGGYAGNDVSMDPTALLGGLDILMKKVDGKMDQLKATADALNGMGAGHPSMDELSARSVEMKQALANVRASLGQ